MYTNTGANTGGTSFLFWLAVKSQTAATTCRKMDKYKLEGNNSLDIKKSKHEYIYFPEHLVKGQKRLDDGYCLQF